MSMMPVTGLKMRGGGLRWGVSKTEHPEGQGTQVHPTLPVYINDEAWLFVYWDHEPPDALPGESKKPPLDSPRCLSCSHAPPPRAEHP